MNKTVTLISPSRWFTRWWRAQPKHEPAADSHAKAVQAGIELAIERIRAQRTEILEAFIAKYGYQPDEAVQIRDGNKWSVQRIAHHERQLMRQRIAHDQEMHRLIAWMRDYVQHSHSLNATGDNAKRQLAQLLRWR